MSKDKLFLRIGALLMLLLGMARGSGGVILLLNRPNTLRTIQASQGIVTGVALGLLFIAILVIVAGIGLLYLRRLWWQVGIAATLLFVIDGAINGWLLFGAPGDSGTVVNIIVAAMIIGCLWGGRRALKAEATDESFAG